jgi:hypothetical protein
VVTKLLALAFAAALFGALACDSGSGCDSGDKKQGSGQSEGMSGGGGGSSHGGGLGETVSFQGLGKKDAPPPTQAGAQAAAAPAGGSGAAAASPAPASQSVLCGGFPNMPADCTTDPAFDAIKKKCCPTGQVLVCQGVPGGARLIGTNCTAPAK